MALLRKKPRLRKNKGEEALKLEELLPKLILPGIL
jgi:hypothetical protein